MNRVLITGIEGFVGRHLAALLADSGHEVTGIHIAPPPQDPRLRLHKADIRDLAALRRIVEDCRPEWVVHLAAVSSVVESESHVLPTYDVNAVGTLSLLEAVRLSGAKARVLLISSADVYGRTESAEPLTEESPLLPVSPYALSKVAAEEAGRFAHRVFGTEVIILRPFSHTGPGQPSRFVFPSAAERIVAIERRWERDPGLGEAGRTLEMGNLEVRRDYSDVRDIVRAYALALEKCEPGVTYNITSGRPVLIRDGIEQLCRMARCPVTYTSTAERRRERDLPLLTGDPSRFRAATGWQPEIPFEQTLRELLDYWRGRNEE